MVGWNRDQIRLQKFEKSCEKKHTGGATSIAKNWYKTNKSKRAKSKEEIFDWLRGIVEPLTERCHPVRSPFATAFLGGPIVNLEFGAEFES